MGLPAVLRAAARPLAAALALIGCSQPAGVSGPESDGLVFVRQTAEGADLFRARLADGAIERLTKTPDRNEDWPDWSSHARRLAFLAAPGGGRATWDLLVWSPGRRGQAAIYASGQTEYFHDWSPTAPVLAYSHQTPAGEFVVAQVDVVESTRRVLATASGAGFLARPSFAFDGRRLLAQEVAPGGASRLLLLDGDAKPRRLTGDEELYDDHARFTRGDAWVAFDRRASREAPADLMLIRPDGSETRNLTDSPEHDDHSPRVSPVRDELAFVSNRSGVNDVYVVDYASGAVRRLTDTPDASEWMPQFSPDGERIVFVILPASFDPRRDRLDYATARIAVVDREGRRLFETDGTNPDWMPAWED
jgi:TolB protein